VSKGCVYTVKYHIDDLDTVKYHLDSFRHVLCLGWRIGNRFNTYLKSGVQTLSRYVIRASRKTIEQTSNLHKHNSHSHSIPYTSILQFITNTIHSLTSLKPMPANSLILNFFFHNIKPNINILGSLGFLIVVSIKYCWFIVAVQL
jgi:hypothetical protein